MRLLVTNDDGVDSVGIQVLAAALADAGHEVLVVAPSSDHSGVSSALGSFSEDDDLEAHRVELPEAPGVEAWALDGPPAMCVLSGALGGFGDRPDLVVSGINAGLNTGRAILHSGTVGACLTAQNFGLSGLAVSAQTADPWRWDTAAALAVDVLPLVIDGPPRTVLNLNVPARDLADVKGIRWTRLAAFGEMRASMVGTDRPPAEQPATDAADRDDDRATGRRRSLKMELRLIEHTHDPETDGGAVAEGWASLTTLVGVVEAWPGEEGLTAGDPLAEVTPSLVPGAPLHEAHRVPDPDADATMRRPDTAPAE